MSRTVDLIIQDTINGDPNYGEEGDYWLDIENKIVKKLQGGAWATVLSFADTNHVHTTLGDIDFTGTVSAGGYAGVTQRVTIGTKKLTLKQGICIAVEDA